MDEGARQYPTGMDVGRRAVNEHRSRRMLRSVRERLFGLPNSFPSQASVALRCNPSAATDLNVRSKKEKKIDREIGRECLRRDGIQ